MERQKVIRSAAPGYPARTALTPTGARRLALAAALGTAPLTACQTGARVDGTGIDPNEPWARDLPSEGSRAVELTDGAELSYHLELSGYGEAHGCLLDRENALLVKVDEVLAVEPGATFAEGSDLAGVTSEVVDAMIEFCESEQWAVEQSTLVVDQLTWPQE